jgi:hypothetical protein
MPMIYIAKGLHARDGHVGEVRDSAVAPYGRMVFLDPRWAGRLVNGAAYSQGMLLHEWAHVFQKSPRAKWEVEGGATDFQRYASPRVFGNGPGPYPVGYKKFAERVAAEKGDQWIRRGQFGHRRGGRVRRFANGGVVSTSGNVTWFNGGPTSGGSDTSRPGVALNLDPGTDSGWDNPTTEKWMELSRAGHPVYAHVEVAGHSANLPITDRGPAGWTGNAIDVTEGGVRKLGFTTDTFPSGATGTATVGGGGSDEKETKQERIEKTPAHGRTKLSYPEKMSRIDTRIAEAETTTGTKDDRRAFGAKLNLLRRRKAYVEKKVRGINKALKGKLKPPVRERLLQEREGFLSELSSIPGEASGLISGLRESGVDESHLRKAARGFGIGVTDLDAEKPTARDYANMQMARAELTPDKKDDLKALEKIVKVSRDELKAAKKTGDPRKIEEATRNLKESADALRDAKPTPEAEANKDLALAELTKETGDDKAALERLKAIAERQLAVAMEGGDAQAITEAAQNLKSAADALAAMTPTATDYANRDLALAELTEGTEDDREVLGRLVQIAQQELAAAQASEDPRAIAEAAANLKAAADALKAATPTATDYANRDLALAELTESTDDDRVALEKLKVLAQEQLDHALATEDPRDDIEAAQNLKSINDALEAGNDLMQQQQDLLKERNELDQKFVRLAETQGPSFMAAFVAFLDGAMGGPIQTNSRLATAGVSADYR